MANAKTRGDVDDWLDGLDPATTPASDAADLRRIGAALANAIAVEIELTKAVGAARAAGRSWATIGMVLGVSKQAAQERFKAKINS